MINVDINYYIYNAKRNDKRNPYTVPPLSCVDGYRISIQASAMHYCTPRTQHPDGGSYTHFELGYPSAPDDVIEPFRESEGGDIYPQVPLAVVVQLLRKHGGIRY
jgi:hypothetical protein